MGRNQESDPEKEKKRQKGLRKMGKILGKAWALPNAEPFHSTNGTGKGSSILCLADLGQKIDDEGYRYGRHGWEDFARDIGGVYNRHIQRRKTKHSKLAKTHLNEVASMLAEKDESLAKAAREHVPGDGKGSKKRRNDDGGDGQKAKRRSSARSIGESGETLSERQERAMENLFAFIEENGGSRESIQNFHCRVTRKSSDGRYETNYFNEEGKRFRSMVEVAKFLSLITRPARSAGGKKAVGMKKRKATSREIENEKKKLRKELEKLRRQHTKARKQLDDFLTEEKESRYPIEDTLLQEEGDQSDSGQTRRIIPTNCPSARVPDISNFQGLPQYCMPEVLAVWDFLSTFSRALNLNPISLDDFLHCLVYKPPPNLSDSDVFSAPPVFLGEAHLGLLKLILSDRTSDDWWWSILETDVTENAVADVADAVGTEESDLPLIKVDFAALLMEAEDPLITTSWLQNLEKVRTISSNDANAIRDAVKNAMVMVANKWVLAYLRKALKLGKTSGASFMKRSIVWLVEKVKDAKPELGSRTVKTKSVLQKRAKVVEEVLQQMEKLSAAALAVTDDDLASDIEDSDDESDESDDEEEKENADESPASREDPDEFPASYVPKKPQPTLVDLLLPPGKPIPPTDLLNPASWPPMAGAAASRIIHRYKRLRNELDDSLRIIRELPRLTVKQRRERELISSSRVFSEFAAMAAGEDLPQKASNHLCSGGQYLDLSPLERLSVLRVLIDAAYDTGRVYEIVDSNHKQRTNAVKALETERRRAKREAKEKAAAGEAAAREDLALEARRNFIDEKREELRKSNEANHELTEQEIDELTEEDILDLDDDIRADFEALPAPESFKKTEVIARVAQIEEAAAFETELLTVLTMDQLLAREKAYVDNLEKELHELGGEDALLDPELDRSIVRRIEKLRRELAKITNSAEALPIQREAAIDTLKEAIVDGTMKSLRAAIRIAKTARLFGPDDETYGVWALDVVRDAHMELENAKNLKRVADAQKDLITKLNRCFTRTEPLGIDRFRNRLWRFENTEQCYVWAEVSPVLAEADASLSNENGFLQIVSKADDVLVGAGDIEEDFIPSGTQRSGFQKFSRQEYHESGIAKSLTRRYWGYHTTESSVRALMKGLDDRGMREKELKTNLKEALEKVTAAETPQEEAKTTIPGDSEETNKSGEVDDEDEKAKAAKEFQTSGDEIEFGASKQVLSTTQSDVIDQDFIGALSSAIGLSIRVRVVVETTRDVQIARYENGSITGWKFRTDFVAVEPDGDEFDPQTKEVQTAIWCVLTEKGQELWLTGQEVIEGICRHRKKAGADPTYFESDATFLAYRNALGRHCGKAADAAQALTPLRFAQFMVRREAELYQRLKHRVYDNTWGGKSGNRNAWIASMKDFAFDLETAKEGLLTLESALMELTAASPEENATNAVSGRELLDNPTTREDIELESIEKSVNGIWNSPASRSVFLEIMKSCKTVGFLVLGLELVSRNTRAYIDANTTKGGSNSAAQEATSSSYYDSGLSSRSSRRSMNSWQQHEDLYYDEAPMRSSRRVARVNYMGLD